MARIHNANVMPYIAKPVGWHLKSRRDGITIEIER